MNQRTFGFLWLALKVPWPGTRYNEVIKLERQLTMIPIVQVPLAQKFLMCEHKELVAPHFWHHFNLSSSLKLSNLMWEKIKTYRLRRKKDTKREKKERKEKRKKGRKKERKKKDR